MGAANAQGERYLPDVLPVLRAHERTVLAHEATDEGVMMGINDRIALAHATAVAQRRIHEHHMLAGVTIIDPAATVIDVDVEIGPDTVIAPFTSLHGSTEIGEGSTIGPHATVIDSRVGNGAKIVHCYTKEADIGDRVSVGPFAYLRPGAVLREGSKVGHVCRGQELGHRPRHQGSAPVLHRRCGHRGGHEHRRRHDHGQLRRLPQAPDHNRLAREGECRHDVHGAGDAWATTPIRRPAR